ncbi:mevalonate kinase [Mesonia hippocampi]|uniref:Mevalonate kinase n=1 Tax=Mesonia hippocampi TaxID=1628250 RepID=A0A840EJ46_9FLAO|nr:GYDIA family GHMP kinase [Mesonia hippocampi]MBB4119382.1 mevalonate kinase [Mesonia hippocampi]
MKTYNANGKLLLTSEYVVLDQALALALPCKYGQRLTAKPIAEKKISWKSYLHDNSVWMDLNFDISNGDLPKINHQSPEEKFLYQILIEVKKLNSKIFNQQGWEINNYLEFPRDWGLGSSSTLIYNLSQWAKINPYELLQNTFGGSGYDIACAGKRKPILYQKANPPLITEVPFSPSFKDKLFFIHLNKKKNSREAILHYRNLASSKRNEAVNVFSELTQQILAAKTLLEFQELIDLHEEKLSNLLEIPTIKECLFPDYPGSIKSLGGWGGDFVLATAISNDLTYFKKKGYPTIIPYTELIL